MSRNNKRNKNRRRRIRRQRRNGAFGGSRFTVPLHNNMVPDRVKVRLKVSEIFDLQAASGQFAGYLIGNSLFNPGGTNFNTQPAGFNQWMAFYAKYRVHASRVNFKLINNGDAAVTGAWIVCYPNVENTILSGSVATAITQTYSRSTYLGNWQGIGIKTLTNSMRSAKIFGHNILFDEGFAGDLSSAPNYKWYWIIELYSIGGDIDVQALLTMSFDVEFYARITQQQSLPPALIEEKLE